MKQVSSKGFTIRKQRKEQNKKFPSADIYKVRLTDITVPLLADVLSNNQITGYYKGNKDTYIAPNNYKRVKITGAYTPHLDQNKMNFFYSLI